MLLSTLILFLCVSLHAQKYTYSDKDEVFLGINFDEISKTKAQLLGFDNLHGAYITSVIENTAAEKAGLQPFDYLYAIGEYALDDENDLGDVLDRFKAGDETKLHLVRAGKNKSQCGPHARTAFP